MSRKAAYVTLLTKASYLAGTLVLDHGLRSVHSKYPLVVMVTPSLAPEAREVLRMRGVLTRDIQSLQPRMAHTLSAHDARFADTWTKLRIPANCAHSKVEGPKALPPPCTPTSPRPYKQLNSGTVVLNPSEELHEGIVHFLSTYDKIADFVFPDQDLLTAYFEGRWQPLHWYYNALRTLRYTHPNLWKDDESRITPQESEAQLGEMNRWWWKEFDELGDKMQKTDPSGWQFVLSSIK
ncbi:hypothetical protein C0993_001525 [Termitomyces sp. T159_Od127]|nr:hypothetical protein C0993_001525 [Termitomyces sp. T159_Od127]